MNKLKQVVALLVAAVHPKCHHIFKSPGRIDAEEYREYNAGEHKAAVLKTIFSYLAPNDLKKLNAIYNTTGKKKQ